MNYVKSLIRLIEQGIQTQVMLRDGSMIHGFWPHDIIARGSAQAGVTVVRGVVHTASQSFEELVVPLCDIGGVFGVRTADDADRPDPDSIRSRPVPRGWTTIHRLSGPV